VVGSLDSLDFTTDVKLLSLVVEVRDGRMGIVVSTHDVDSLKMLVGAVDVVH
jgi:ABC-type Mn2+/Zn2+ transport system ATPase subunit